MVLARFGKTDKKNDYRSNNAMIGISVGQNYHSPEKFTALTKLIARSSFKKTYLMIADTLQAHNILLRNETDTLEEARKIGKSQGDDFINNTQENLPYFNEVIRWNMFINDDRYQIERKFINDLYNTDKDFAKSVNNVAGKFLASHARKLAENESFKIDIALSHCHNYLKEELAVMLLWLHNHQEFPFDIIIYPKPMHQASQYIFNKFASDTNILKELIYSFGSPSKKHNNNNLTTNAFSEDIMLIDALEDSIHSLYGKLITLKRQLRNAQNEEEDASILGTIRAEILHILNRLEEAHST